MPDAIGRSSEEWRDLQSAALGLGGKSFEWTCAAALGLYDFAAEEVAPLLDGRQGKVMERPAQSANL